MPVAESPSYHGYDVSDYYTVEPAYGTNDDFKRLVAAAHRRGITVLVDMVLNHSSSEHPWFQAALRDTTSPYRSWYRFSPRAARQGPLGRGGVAPLPGARRVLLRRVLERHAGSQLPHAGGRRGGEEDRRRSGCATWGWTASGSMRCRTWWRRAAAIRAAPARTRSCMSTPRTSTACSPAAYTVGEAWGNIAAVAALLPRPAHLVFRLRAGRLAAVGGPQRDGGGTAARASCGCRTRCPPTAGRRS